MGAQTTDEILAEIKEKLPENFDGLSGEEKLSLLLQAADAVLGIEGTWILVNGDLTLLELMKPPEKENENVGKTEWDSKKN